MCAAYIYHIFIMQIVSDIMQADSVQVPSFADVAHMFSLHTCLAVWI